MDTPMEHSFRPIRWFIPAHPAAVYGALTDATAFPAWWALFRSVQRTGSFFQARSQGWLRFDLTPGEGNQSKVIEWHLHGDVDGIVRIALLPRDGGTEVTLDRRITVSGMVGPLMNWLAAGRLTGGESGLIRYLEQKNLLNGDIPSTNDEVTATSLPLALSSGAVALAILWWRRRG